MDMSGSIDSVSIFPKSQTQTITSPDCQNVVEDLSDRNPLVPGDRLAIFIVKIDAIHQFSINIKLLMESGSIANADRGATSVAGKMTAGGQ